MGWGMGVGWGTSACSCGWLNVSASCNASPGRSAGSYLNADEGGGGGEVARPYLGEDEGGGERERVEREAV